MRQYVTKEKLNEIRATAAAIANEMGISKYTGVSGLYFIKIYDIIVYIGSSTDLAYRIARHKMHILNPLDEPELKYDVMREVYNKTKENWKIVIQPLPASEINNEEYKLIDIYKPIFNEKFAIYNYFNGWRPISYKYIDKKEYPNAKQVLRYLNSGERY